jgi:protein phosphatase PTC1
MVWSCLPSEGEYSFKPKLMKHEFFKVGVSHDIDESVKEETCTVKIPFLNEDSAGYFGLFEGHRGGWAAASAASNYLHEILQSEIGTKKSDFGKCFESAFEKLDARIKSISYDRGTSASVCLVRKGDDQSFLHFANVGDTRAILCRRGKAVRLTQDHTIADEKEKGRLEACRAYLKSNDKIRGLVRHTRALGDHVVKQWVISTPHYSEIELSPDDSFFLLVSHGLCAVMTDQEAVEIAQSKS